MKIFCLALVFQCVNIAAQVVTNIWLSKWSDDPVYENATEARKQINMRLGVYGAVGAVQSEFAVYLRSTLGVDLIYFGKFNRLLNDGAIAPQLL